MNELVLATGNPGKLSELQRLTESIGLAIYAQSEFGIDAPEEIGLTFVENALIKARHACTVTRLPAIADDSGLIVDALNGHPGIYSARYAGEEASDDDNVVKLLHELAEIEDSARSARFLCAAVMLEHCTDPSPLIYQGIWEGKITQSPRGRGGFGYDPVFFVPELGKTAAELTPEEKNRISHRSIAITRLVNGLKIKLRA